MQITRLCFGDGNSSRLAIQLVTATHGSNRIENLIHAPCVHFRHARDGVPSRHQLGGRPAPSHAVVQPWAAPEVLLRQTLQRLVPQENSLTKFRRKGRRRAEKTGFPTQSLLLGGVQSVQTRLSSRIRFHTTEDRLFVLQKTSRPTANGSGAGAATTSRTDTESPKTSWI